MYPRLGTLRIQLENFMITDIQRHPRGSLNQPFLRQPEVLIMVSEGTLLVSQARPHIWLMAGDTFRSYFR